jgi:hypothetical protein
MDSRRAGSLPTSESNAVTNGEGNSLNAMLRTIGRDLDMARVRLNASRSNAAGNKQQFDEPSAPSARPVRSSRGTGQVADPQLELSKLLRCNYSGVSNLYWCDSNSAAPESE